MANFVSNLGGTTDFHIIRPYFGMNGVFLLAFIGRFLLFRRGSRRGSVVIAHLIGFVGKPSFYATIAKQQPANLLKHRQKKYSRNSLFFKRCYFQTTPLGITHNSRSSKANVCVSQKYINVRIQSPFLKKSFSNKILEDLLI